jgi:hypothetical protein
MDKRHVIIRVPSDGFPLGGPHSSGRESAGILVSKIKTNFGWMAGSLALALAFISSALTARANVYATDIRLNGSQKAAVILPGDSLTISYILNDTATGGVWVRIYSGTNVIQTLASADEKAGTNAGTNFAIWSETPDLAEGVYTVGITAASAGYDTWTNITDDGTNFNVQVPRGISVNQNTNSLFYGRVYVASAYGDNVGIFKCNADGSPADEGGFSTGGWGWAGDHYSPWKMAVGADDRLYVDDFANQGVVVSFDPTIETNHWRQVIRTDNYPAGGDTNASLSGLSVIGAATNEEIWMTDASTEGSAGIIDWQLTTDGIAATNDTGAVIVPLDSLFLTQEPYDLAVDSNGYIYTIQFLTLNEDPAGLALLSYDLEPVTTVRWAVAMYPTLLRAYGVAVDPAATVVAVAVVGPCDTESACGGLYLFSATNDGEFISNLDQTGGDAYYDVAWDSVGNLYALDGGSTNRPAVWRAYSPPGTNQATTVAVPVIQAYNALLPPSLINPVAYPGGLRFTLEGQSNVTYVIQGSSDLFNWTAVATNFSANTNRCICAPASGDQVFYRATTAP